MGWSPRQIREYQKSRNQKPSVPSSPEPSFRNTIAAAYEREYGVAEHNNGEESFITAWKRYAANIPFPFKRQVKFKDNRNWRLDFYDETAKMGVEVSGGAHIAGIARLEQDFEKINMCQLDGIALMHFTPRQVIEEPDKVIKSVLECWQKRKDVMP